jgi:Recombination endonuclease VII
VGHASGAARSAVAVELVDPLQPLREYQAGVCAICKRTDRPLVVDHDHQSGLVRGLLCVRCNNDEGKHDFPWIKAYRAYPPALAVGISVKYGRHQPRQPRRAAPGEPLRLEVVEDSDARAAEQRKFWVFIKNRRSAKGWRDFEFAAHPDDVAAAANQLGAAGDLEKCRTLFTYYEQHVESRGPGAEFPFLPGEHRPS